MQNDSDANGDRRPQDTAFKQQRLPAWQPILTPKYVICSFTSIAVVFIAVGIALVIASDNVVERSQRYDDLAECQIGDSDYGRVCEVEIAIEEDIELPVFVYYELDNFFQNHRRYVKSRSDSQLQGSDDTDGCEPLEEYNDLTLYPCGLIAHSYFSDQIIGAITRDNQTYSLIPTTDYDTAADYLAFTNYSDEIDSWRKQGIAWDSDVEAKFALLDGLDSIDDLDLTQFTREGPEQLRINTALNLSTTDDGAALIPSPLDEDLIVWMRTAGLPSFKKLYRKINSLDGAVTSDATEISNDTDMLLAGDTLKFKVRNFFRVTDFEGQKAIVISTVSFVGGKNAFLGIAYLVVGGIILFLAFAFFVKHLVSPRKLGDMRYFNWSSNDGRQRTAN